MITTIVIGGFVLIGFAVAFLLRCNLQKATDGLKTDEFRRQINFHVSPANLFALCHDSLKLIKGHKIEYQNEDEGKIVAKLPFSWVSSGETITFQITRKKDTTSLGVLAVPLLASRIYNFQNSEKIMEYIMTHTDKRNEKSWP